ncbi:MAG: tyrosine-type recombinase/integrase [Verrucomicrobiota bacterium]
MASLWKHPQSKYWVARFCDPTGKTRNRSTKETNRRLAQKIADSFEDATRKKRTIKQVREVIAALHQEITGENVQSPSFKLFISGWIKRKAPEVKASTLKFYEGTTKKFITFLGKLADVPMSEITVNHVVKYRNEQAEKLAARTANHDLKALKTIFRDALRDQAISEDPSANVIPVKPKKTETTVRRRAFTVEELKAVVSVADAEWKSMICFGLYTGQRLADIAGLKWENVDLKRGQIRLVTGKTEKVMLLPIAAPLRKLLVGRVVGPEAQPIHPNAFEVISRNTTASLLSAQFGRLLATVGLKEKKPHRKSAEGRDGARRGEALSFHCLRHTAVTFLKDAGIPQAAVMELVGHDSEQMSAHYTHVGFDALNQAAQALPDVFAAVE